MGLWGVIRGGVVKVRHLANETNKINPVGFVQFSFYSCTSDSSLATRPKLIAVLSWKRIKACVFKHSLHFHF